MTTFVQIHVLASYPAANLNRDDSGRPKTVIMGGVPRLRISSQSLKRAWRTSDAFQAALNGHLAQRTKRLGEDLYTYLSEKGMADAAAVETARAIADLFGKLEDSKDAHPLHLRQLAFISPQERDAAFALADKALTGEPLTDSSAIKKDTILRRTDTAADIALFGRMLADDPRYNREAAAQVAHAMTTHRVVVEDDYYTAVDDLKDPHDADDAGAAHVGVQEFGAGVFYLYTCINHDLLVENLEGHTDLANDAIAALVRAAATVTPKGKLNSFAHHTLASFVLVERGEDMPRGLSSAFLKPVGGHDQMTASVKSLIETRAALTEAYGNDPAAKALDLTKQWPGAQGSIDALANFAVEAPA
ncbi:type I-E CRISPR-associated protein Cas7/Cse4/CasC [Rhodothalassium salexigens]|uniref:type I-E CRISPR-associated protein Cas7/Cse4/CasC n=1 Tax=Rhodothalassium salexigens TaxID=1086 RepID=UPI0019140AC6|nr:type I-E CRISPR-associated protein Cas7/Cse4/CasC [Rhodothalassium salexigens]MBK5911022.1 type I-E CRISPR-associated protein Cas7/Cse4/CasC [Rhodothalassium salexigens]MBK5920398.1 type I-E CRISPR-associated protein Cas7/Cse4/CasC [Rhodothalassium salexigens]